MHGERKHETEEWYVCMYAVIRDEKEKGGRRGAYIRIEEEQSRRNVMWCRKKIRLKLFGNTPTKREKERPGGR